MFWPDAFGEAAPIENEGIGAEGIALGSSALEASLEATAGSPLTPTDGFAASSALRLNADIKKMAHAAVAIIFVVDLIVASRTARRDHQKSERRVNSTLIELAKQLVARTGLRPPWGGLSQALTGQAY